ncbi:hypothetical protein [Caldinitratiruptor microaerophilus]|uniref:Uncharacterized protein n=1 Tax=Caldinitratiruptor microaerophilus TaxID=671077 RepID=A0AA35G6Y5_9FIRM|nr:hypothetical protein [Caldinitratiruptor microaerophilus]BDG59210.1 hypothetical protein caldi_03000 [Caldinitratiruptor microaerophilus]
MTQPGAFGALPEDVYQLVLEHADGEAEREALLAAGRQLTAALAAPVEARPEFVAALRARLVAEAGRILAGGATGAGEAGGPGEAEPARVLPVAEPGGVVGAGRAGRRGRLRLWLGLVLPAAAAAAVVSAALRADGLPLWRRARPLTPAAQIVSGTAATQDLPAPPGREPAPGSGSGSGGAGMPGGPAAPDPGGGGGRGLAGVLAQTGIASYAPAGTELVLPVPRFVPVDDGVQVPPGAQPVAGLAHVDLDLQVLDVPHSNPPVFRLLPVGWPAERLAAVAQALDLGAPGVGGPGERVASSPDGSRRLRATAAGELVYEERPSPPGDARQAGEAEARAAVEAFFARSGLIAPAGDATVRRATFPDRGIPDALWLEWPGQLPGGYVLLGAPDRAVVAPWGQVLQVRLQPIRAERLAIVPLKSVEEAAQELNGLPIAAQGPVTLTAVKLVYGRPEAVEAGEDLVAQPYYRFVGRTAEGWPFTGYVPATAGAPGPARPGRAAPEAPAPTSGTR